MSVKHVVTAGFVNNTTLGQVVMMGYEPGITPVGETAVLRACVDIAQCYTVTIFSGCEVDMGTCMMDTDKFDIGNVLRSSVEFRDACNNDILVDPADVSLDILDPAGNETTHRYGTDVNVIRTGVGQYYYNKLIDQPGYWYFRWHSGAPTPSSKEIVVKAVAAQTYP